MWKFCENKNMESNDDSPQGRQLFPFNCRPFFLNDLWEINVFCEFVFDTASDRDHSISTIHLELDRQYCCFFRNLSLYYVRLHKLFLSLYSLLLLRNKYPMLKTWSFDSLMCDDLMIGWFPPGKVLTLTVYSKLFFLIYQRVIVTAAVSRKCFEN